MKILVTGASGFAGSHLVEALLARGEKEIYGTVYNGAGVLENLLPKDHIIPINLMDALAVRQMIKTIQPDQIYHLAAFAFVGKSFERGAELLTNNIALQENMFSAIKELAPHARVLIVGSAEEYGLSDEGEIPITEEHPFRPVNPYSVSKVAQDLLGFAYAKSYNMNVVRVRPFNHIGERQTPEFAIPAFAKQVVAIEKGDQENLKVGNLTGVRDFTDVKDMVLAYITVMERGEIGEVYNIGSGVGTSMQEIVDALIAQSTAQVKIVHDESRMRPLDIPVMIADASKVMALGWKPTIALKETLKRVLEYWRTV